MGGCPSSALFWVPKLKGAAIGLEVYRVPEWDQLTTKFHDPLSRASV